jgi:hypothetical protein
VCVCATSLIKKKEKDKKILSHPTTATTPKQRNHQTQHTQRKRER